MDKLNKDLLLKKYPEYASQMDLPERIIQFGEGNFLRGFVDWMVHQLNKNNLFNGRIVAIQPTPHGKVVPKLQAQDCLYTVNLRGIVDGQSFDKSEIVTSISRGINPYQDWQEVLQVAELDSIEFVFSNTTEAGLSYLEEAFDESSSPLSFPGKLTAFLYHRFKVKEGSGSAGLTIMPCELVENNGEILKELVLKYVDVWNLPNEFKQWVLQHNEFCNTLVDRIVTGYPKGNIEEFEQKLGYEDILLTVGEPYHLFAIDASEKVRERIPFHKIGLNVKWGNVDPHREIKVRLLNGAHTMMFATSYLSGVDTVREAMENTSLKDFVKAGMFNEIVPVVNANDEEKEAFANSVIERFLNPFTKHFLTDIGLNSVYKFKTRLVPTLLDYVNTNHKLPSTIVFSLSALLYYYKSTRVEGELLIGKRAETEYIIRDEKETLQVLRNVWFEYEQGTIPLSTLVTEVLKQESFWGVNLTELEGLEELVTIFLNQMERKGMTGSVNELLGNVTNQS